MTRQCPTCSRPLPTRTRSRFCPRCSLRGALELTEDEAIPPLENGRLIGDYELLEMLGRGGMGVVYRARQRSLNRLVAVKLLVAGEFADTAARRRFQAEAAAAARLRHPHIVAIHEIGDHEGQPFFSMELVEGRTFADLVRDGPLPPGTAARLLKPVAEAVQFAHSQGVLHRDLKPSNLLLDGFGQPHVSDFGLARRLDNSERFTLTGEVLGSPSYLAPEQARGDRAHEGPASDVYALGAILYQMLTGRPPFLGASPQAILRQVIETEPLAPRKLNPAIPLDLETVCLKCLEKEPARRYPTAQALAAELDRFLKYEPLQARPVGWAGRTWRWALRHPAKAGLSVALVMMFLTIAIVPTLAYLRISRAEQARTHQLRETLLTQARAVRLGGHSRQRHDGWAALVDATEASVMAPDAEFISRLRHEAIANLALDDAWFEPATNLPPITDPTMLRFDPRQEIFAAGDFLGRVQLTRETNPQPVGSLVFTNQRLQHVVDFSPNQRFLALRHRERISIWEVKTGKELLSEVAGLNQFSIHPNSTAVLYLTRGQLVNYALPSGEKLWSRAIGPVESRAPIAISPQARWLAVGWGGERGVDVLDLQSQAVVSLRLASGVTALAWSREGHWLATGSDDGSIRVWNLRRVLGGDEFVTAGNGPLEPRWIFETHGTFVQALAFSPDHHWLVAAANDEAIHLLDLRTGRPGLHFEAVAYRLDFALDGSRVGPVWQSGRVGWLHVTDSPVLKTTRFPSRGSGPTLALSPAGDECVVASTDEVFLFKDDWTQADRTLPFTNARAAYYQPDGTLLTVTFTNSTLWPRPDNSGPESPRDFLSGYGGEVAAFSKDRRTVAFANYRADTVDVLHDGRLVRRFAHERVHCVSLHPTGQTLVSTALDIGGTFLWDVAKGERLANWPDDGGNRTTFSPDGKWLVQFGPRCALFDTKSWKPRPLLSDIAPNASPADAQFSPDGRWLAVIMADREVYLLRTTDFATVAVLDAPSNARLHRIAWDQGGEKLAVLAAQNTLQMWDLKRLRTNLSVLKADWPE